MFCALAGSTRSATRRMVISVRRSGTKVALTLAFLGLLGCLLFSWWKPGRPFDQRIWSPNRHYYVQKYDNWKPRSCVPGLPGHGSDNLGGYIRLYDAGDRLVGERFVSFSRDVVPVWDKRSVYLLGVEMEVEPFVLSESSE